jgi:hypothetical protein
MHEGLRRLLAGYGRVIHPVGLKAGAENLLVEEKLTTPSVNADLTCELFTDPVIL